MDLRKKDINNVSGIKVYPREVEDVLFEIEALEKAVVIGVPDSDLPRSERIIAQIVLKEWYKESDEFLSAIREFCRKRISP